MAGTGYRRPVSGEVGEIGRDRAGDQVNGSFCIGSKPTGRGR